MNNSSSYSSDELLFMSQKKPILEWLLGHSFPLFSRFTLYILPMHALLEMLLSSVWEERIEWK